MAKYQQVYQDMLDNNKKLFNDFMDLHDKYEKDAKKWQKEFNEKGEEVLQIIRRYENMLCSHSEGGKYGVFSSGLADKFWSIVRKDFPKIDFVGML